ncbi:SDR family NAD(P)-dependent oxidoreductase [Oecophyllibacter saccharovorans]|uniref:SDR family oxidoreductase n=1 Tax=Oecophyllibacter saccharovorans TaxID=2558360 RepID=A0A506UQN9_9PROT|nr:SDR family oxidoreductase [Oecophyllibacter saccharovorans]TPW35609.1 SDR family oxidoreductase [Oecophyllibacter saccharovorans]
MTQVHPSASQADYWNDKVVFITGASSGIGQASALAFARLGAQLILVGRAEAPLLKTQQEIEAAGGKKPLCISGCDVSVESHVADALKEVESRFGRLDAAFNNAGMAQSVAAGMADISAEEWNRVLDVNLRGVFFSMKYEIPLMLKSGGGRIVNTSSVAGEIGFAGVSAYCASKWGVIGLTKAAALDYARHNICINALCPGPVETPLLDKFLSMPDGREKILAHQPDGRVGQPGEMAETVVSMCAPWNSFMTGTTVTVDGGQTAGIIF